MLGINVWVTGSNPNNHERTRMKAIDHIDLMRQERAHILGVIVNLQAELRNIKDRQANAQSRAQQDANDRDHRRTLHRLQEAQARSSILKDSIKTANARLQIDNREVA